MSNWLEKVANELIQRCVERSEQKNSLGGKSFKRRRRGAERGRDGNLERLGKGFK